MVNKAKGRLFQRKDGKYLLYLPKKLVEDSMFPFKINPSLKVTVHFAIGENKLIVEQWTDD